MRYFYARVSSKDQNLARQLEAAKNYKDDIDRVFCDKQSGKNFERKEYEEMKAIVQCGDEVIIKELDRLGRNSDMMKEELKWFADHGIIVRILDIPTTLIEIEGQEWVIKMINNVLIEVLSAIAEQERLKIQKRREEGIAAMPTVDGKKVSAKTGRGFGRPSVEVEVRQLPGETVADACKRLGISRATFYRKVG